jgi:hypothetical protein
LDYISNSKKVLRSIDLNEKMYGDEFEVYNPSFLFLEKRILIRAIFPEMKKKL